MKALLILVVFLANSVSFQTPVTQSPAPIVPFVSVDRIGEANARSFFVFNTNSRNYVIRHDGFSEGWSAAKRKKVFELKMGAATRLQRLYFAEYEGDLLLEYEVSDGRSDRGYLSRMDQTGMKLKWIAPLSATNLGPALIEGHALYVGAANMLAKLDLQTGKQVWEQSAFAEVSLFGLPIVKTNSIVFQDDVDTSRSIEVDKQTGRIQKH